MHLRNQYRGLDIDEVSLSERPRFQESEQLSSSVSFPRDSLKKLTLSYSCFAGISSPIHSIAVLSSLLESSDLRRYSYDPVATARGTDMKAASWSLELSTLLS